MAIQLKIKALIPRHPLTNFKIKEYYENEPRLNSVYSRDNLSKVIKNGTYVINLDEYVKNNEVIHFDSFGVLKQQE